MNLNMQIFHMKKMKKYNKHKVKYLFLEGHNYTKWFDIKMIQKQMMKNQIMISLQCHHQMIKKVLAVSPLGYKKRFIQEGNGLLGLLVNGLLGSQYSTNKNFKV